MSSKSKFEITVLTIDKTGILSRLMKKGTSMGMVYRRQKTDNLDKNLRIKLTFSEEPNCTKRELINTFLNDPDVLKVEKVRVSDDSGKLTTIKNDKFVISKRPAIYSIFNR